MSPEQQALWERLEAFDFDLGAQGFSFTQRLAREQGWTAAETQRVLREYRRFLFLAFQAGHPVSPSEAVDQAWHLHLVYTRSYWERLCRDVLGGPFHHEPSVGGRAESEKFTDWYARTLESYARFFGPPPEDLWPARPVHVRHRWVETEKYWVVRKPWA